jgi:two-component system, OmpR family, sensor histidine kinase NblS
LVALLNLLNQIRDIIARWWSEFTLQTRLMAAATLVVSLLMSGLTFWAVNTIQQDARLNDTRFGRDLGLLLAANVAPLVGENNRTELARFSHSFYSSTSSVRYMLYADKDGEIFFGIPFSESEVQNSLTIRRRMQLPDNYAENQEEPMVRQHITPDGEVTDVFIPLIYNGEHLGVLALGINPNPTVVTSSHLTRDVTIAVFISIWVMVILGAVFNALIITKPIKELLQGVKNIAAGNFKQRIDLPVRGELGELILNFNEMAERLERYEEQNIEELTAEKAKLETLVSTIADGAVLLDTHMRVILVNPTAQRIFAWDENEHLLGENVLHHLPDSVKVELTRPLYQLASGDPPAELREGAEFRLTLPDPSNRTVRLLLNTVLDQHRENVRGIAITVQDITREVELNEAKSQFISNVSHELRTPLFNIKSFIETLHEYGDNLSELERREFLETANRETDRLTRLVNDVLDLSRLESNKRYHFEAVEIIQPIEQTLRTHQLNARDKGIELIQDIEPDLPPVLGNYDLLLQVFSNLVGNGLKFTSAGGRVAIRAYLLDPVGHHQPVTHVRIEVADTGIGIDPEDQQAIFDRFFRVENRVHTLEGTGLGLSIVRNIIEKHHSEVHLVSEVGTGTTFWFDLAIYQENAPVLAELPLPGGDAIGLSQDDVAQDDLVLSQGSLES